MNAPSRIFEATPASRPRRTAKRLPSQDELHRMFDYDAGTGDLIWRFRAECSCAWNSRCADQVAGSPTNTGHFQITICNKKYLVHRIIWKWLYNAEPPVIDHKDGNGWNNRDDNLRAATRSENVYNKKRKNKHGLPRGVSIAPSGRFNATIRKEGDKTNLGTFDTAEQAHSAYCSAARVFYREFAILD